MSVDYLCDRLLERLHQKDAVKSGFWPLYRYMPSEAEDGTPFKLDSKKPTMPIKEFVESETRFAILKRTQPERAAELARVPQPVVHVVLHGDRAECQRELCW